MNKKETVITIAILFGGLVGLKVVASVLGAINDIPGLQNVFELVGLVYTLKLVATNIKATNREQTINNTQKALEELGISEQVQTVTETIKAVVGSASSLISKKEEVINPVGWDKVETSVPQEELNKKLENWFEEVDNLSKPVLGDAFTKNPELFYVINPEGKLHGKPFTTEQAAWDTIPEEHLHDYDVVAG